MKLAYSISSHVRFAPFTLPVILPSLKAAGVLPEQVFVCVCGARRERSVVTPLGTLAFREHESKVYASFIEVLARGEKFKNKFSHVFVMQDTCRAGPQFAQLSSQIDEGLDVQVASVPSWGKNKCEAEIGAYRYSVFDENRDYINSLIDIGLKTEQNEPDPNEGVLCSRAERRGKYGEGVAVKNWTPRDVYGMGTPRIEIYYPALDLWKYQSNWGQEPRRWHDMKDTP